MTTLLEETLFLLPDKSIENVTVNRGLVQDRLKAIVEDEDLRKYIL
jgi:ATP-dependent HslUV protease ATP-binding subunit HslU